MRQAVEELTYQPGDMRLIVEELTCQLDSSYPAERGKIYMSAIQPVSGKAWKNNISAVQPVPSRVWKKICMPAIQSVSGRQWENLCDFPTAVLNICAAARHPRHIFCRNQLDGEPVPSDVTPEKSWKFLVFCPMSRIWGTQSFATQNLEAPKGACQCRCIEPAKASGHQAPVRPLP